MRNDPVVVAGKRGRRTAEAKVARPGAVRLAIMQPYFFPYLGYFQLMAAADKFVIYDDVAFIKRGWINRNRILIQGRVHLFSLPLRGASQNLLINQITLSSDRPWREKLIATIHHAYRKAPQFDDVFPMIRAIVQSPEKNLARYLCHSLTILRDYLAIRPTLIPTSAVYNNRALKGEARILDICELEGATEYLNLPGGTELYDRETFRAQGVRLRFLDVVTPSYQQFGNPFRPSLSIIDLLMFNPLEEIRSWLAGASIS